MTTTDSQRGAANRRKGITTEQQVARYLRAVGFGGAERAEKNGWRTPTGSSPDPGDLTGIPGLVFSIKHDASNQVAKWLDELEVLGNTHGAELTILVVRRRGKAQPAQWWAWVPLATLARSVLGYPARDFTGHVCLELGDLVGMLHTAGYGDPEVST